MSSLLSTTSISLLACAAILAMPARADAEGAAASPSGHPASAPPVLMAQLDSIPTSPAFHMNVTSNVTSDATPPSASHDSPSPRRPAAAAKAPSAPASVAGAVPLQGTRPLIAGPSLRPNLAAFVQHPGALSLAGSAPAVSAVPTLAGAASVAALGSAKSARRGEAAASSPAAVLAAIAAATSSVAPDKAATASAAPSKPASEPAPAAHRPPSTHAVAAAGSAPAATEADVFADLRARLASKLGATSAGAGKSYVMRVSNQGEPGESVVGTAHVEHVAALTSRHAGTHGAAAALDGAASSAAMRTGDWDYTGVNGPEAWSRLKPEFDKCGHGKRQSPIDIRDGIAVDLEPIQFDYHTGAFSVVDTGHAIEVDVAPGNAITISGHRYELANVHFHRPAEERIDGKQFDMSMHLVHKDAQGHVAVVTVLLERGSAQATVQAVLNNLPLEKNETMHASGTLDPAQWLPAERRYYTYMGSLTTPPCTEGVLWMVLKQPVQVAPAQEAIFARLYPMNARPVQAASGRLIKQSE